MNPSSLYCPVDLPTLHSSARKTSDRTIYVKITQIVPLALVSALALALSSCGTDGNNDNSSVEPEETTTIVVETTVETVAATPTSEVDDTGELDADELYERVAAASENYDSLRSITEYNSPDTGGSITEMISEKTAPGEYRSYSLADMGDLGTVETYATQQDDQITAMWSRIDGGEWTPLELSNISQAELEEFTGLDYHEVTLVDAENRIYEIVRVIPEVGEYITHDTFDDQWRLIESRPQGHDAFGTITLEYDVDVHFPQDLPDA